MTQSIFPQISTFILSIFIIFFQFIVPCYSQKVTAPEITWYILQNRDQLESNLDSLMEKYNIPGSGIAIVTKDSILNVGGLGYADIELKKPVDKHIIFRVGFISKSFVALGILKLVEEGKFSLQTNILDIPKKFELKF